MMPITLLSLILTLLAHVGRPQTQPAISPEAESHIQEIIAELPVDSDLRKQLLHGAHGNGVRYPWMDDMRKQNIKCVRIWVDIRFNSGGHPKKVSVNRIEYFNHFEGGNPLLDNDLLNSVRTTGLESELSSLALGLARHGFWTDVPRPKPHPFVGGAQIEFLADEWLPGPSRPLFYTRQL
jgi:hypothetical protein